MGPSKISMCFMKSHCVCDSSCAAYTGYQNGDKSDLRCLVLQAIVRFVEPHNQTKHPRSAPPPEVR